MSSYPFHLAFPVTDLEQAREFYVGLLGCTTGREAPRWIDFNLYGHQVTAHLVSEMDEVPLNPVDGRQVPARHFGVILARKEWDQLADRLRRHNVDFIIPPYIRYEGEIGEQATMFLQDPSGNYLEFKAFAAPEFIFDKDYKD
ncbi:VOC family protein [Luteithermobacter gelatinilyticus]|uniref:VOC family protein n=1 Tax=Luteithermobacter gelatinilyticus TaxID=2582913 RepID=UPI001106D5DF|nr:VOC family protein [Luteithermobacter gelatinilyticus]|tara:strand:- start:11997 stop:12425 length:429 start_codon:yes stop_codon:yes gene_type:complete